MKLNVGQKQQQQLSRKKQWKYLPQWKYLQETKELEKAVMQLKGPGSMHSRTGGEKKATHIFGKSSELQINGWNCQTWSNGSG